MMPVSIEVDADSGIAIGKCSGVLGLADAKAGASTLWQDAAWPGVAVVWDFRDAQLDTTGPEVFELAQYINAHQRSPAPARVAFVTSRDVDYGQVRIFEAYRERPGTEVQVFRDMDAAVDWARAVVRTAAAPGTGGSPRE
jgi:hypothetical protein